MPWKTPDADVGHALRDRLLVDVDAVAVADRERPGVAGRLREADQQQRRPRRRGSSRSGRWKTSSAGSVGAGRPRGTWPTSATPCAPRSKSARREQAADDEHERARHARREEAQAEDHRERDQPDEQRRPADVAERPDPRGELPPGVVAVGRRAGQLRQLADDDVDRGSRRGSRSRPPWRGTARSSPGASSASSRNSAPVTSVIAATSSAASAPPTPGEQHRAARDRGQRRARPRRDVPRRAEQRVDDRAGRGRVQPVLHRHARDARVAEVLRHDHRRDRDPREHVAAEQRAVVARQPVHDRQQPTQTTGPSVIGALHRGRSSQTGGKNHDLPSSTRSAGLPRRRLRTRIVSPARLLTTTWEEAVLAAYTFGQAMWTMFVFFMWILWFWLLFTVFGDLFRRHDIGGWGKAGWTFFVIILPFLGHLHLPDRRGEGRWASGACSRRRQQQAHMDTLRPRRWPARPTRLGPDRQGQGAARQRRDHPGRVRPAEGEGARRLSGWCPIARREANARSSMHAAGVLG